MSLHPILDPQLTGNVGLYYCCYRLSLMGWNVMPTARNARGVDIIAYSRDASRFVGVQVKALSKRNPVPLGTSLDKVMGDFWIIVNKVTTAEELLPTAKARAQKIMSRGLYAVQMAKVAIHNGLNTDLATGSNFEASLFGVTCATEDKKEGMTAFVEKRKPVFPGK